jgi:NYN domain
MQLLDNHLRQCGPGHRERALHLVDLENLAGGPGDLANAAPMVAAAYDAASGRMPGDLLFVATSHFAAHETWHAVWPGVQRLIASGPDGADHALLHVIARERPHDRFTRVVIGSGDGIFAQAAAELQARGCEVTVVSRCDSLSRQLRLAAGEIRYLHHAPDLAPAADSPPAA